MDSVKKLDETALPPMQAFYLKLNGEGIGDEDYEHAEGVERVWNEDSQRLPRLTTCLISCSWQMSLNILEIVALRITN